MNSLQRELKRITPAGITLTLDNTQAQILDYLKTVRNLNPMGYWRLGSLADFSLPGNNNLTATGGVVAGNVASPGLLNAAVASADGATDFNGTSQYLQATVIPAYQATRELTMVAWIQPDTLPTSGNYRPFIASYEVTTYLSLVNGGFLLFSAWLNGVQKTVYTSSAVVVAGTKYMVTGTYDGQTMRIFLNKSLVASADFPPGSVYLGGLLIGAAGFGWFDGKMDEVAVFSKALSQDEITMLYNTGINVK
jgi:hypothetical protein